MLQVLAALAFHNSPDSVTFVNPKRWSREKLFLKASVWDIPLIKPRFGCNYDVTPSRNGYALSKALERELDAFKLGLKCELGFRNIDLSRLQIKPEQEFGVSGAFGDMPELGDFNISVLYRTFAGDAELFNLSITTVIEHFPGAHEIVVVVLEKDESLFEGILEKHRGSAPFPVRIVMEPDLMDGHVQQKYSKVTLAK